MIEERQFPLLDHISSGIVAIERDGSIVLWNERMEHWSGMPRQQVLGRNLFELFPRVGEDAFRIRIEQVLDGGAPVIFSPQLHHHVIPCPRKLRGTDVAEGDERYRPQLVTVSWLAAQSVALFSIQDQSEQMHVLNQHKATAALLSEELRQIKQLRREKRRLLSAIDQAGEAVIIINWQGEIEYHNRAFLEQTGWSPEEIRQMRFYEALFYDHDESFNLRDQEQLINGEVWQGRKDIIRRDGSFFPASISIAPVVRKKKTKKNYFIVIQEDISHYVNLEEKLRHTQKQEALVTLVGGIAHDFNNLLAGLVGQVYLAAREVKALPKTAARLKKIQGITQEAAEIVAQLLTFARQGDLQTTEFPLSSFVKEFIKLARHSVPENIRLMHDFEQGAFNFRGDANQLQQALLNIVQNSVEACEGCSDGVIKIELRAFDPAAHPIFSSKYPVLQRGHFAHLVIRDNGKGIPEEIVDKVFDPFFSTKQLGSGLGLAVVQGCVRHHQGLVIAEPLLGGGTCMHLFLPLLASKEASEPAQVPVHDDQDSATILLVDDDLRVLEPTSELLESMGHRVTVAHNGKEACDIFAQRVNAWDLVITDMVMPQMNGLDACRYMRTLRADIPVIFATGYDRSLMTPETHRMENSQLISKPFNPDELDALIVRMTSSA